MTTSLDKRFEFSITQIQDTRFDVVEFSGTEGLSKLYRFDLTLVSPEAEIDLEAVIQSRAVLRILRPEGEITFHGIVTHFEQRETVSGHTHYQAVLAPAFWRHTLTHHNQVFLKKTVPQIIETALKDVGMTTLDYEFRLSKTYGQREYVCQFNESHYNFVTRWMEHEGLYFFFEQDELQEKLIVTDHMASHTPMEHGQSLVYAPPSGLGDEAVHEETVSSLICRQGILPAQVMLKEFNYNMHDVEMTAQAPVSDKGMGSVYIYGEHFLTQEEGDALALIRAEELKCRARTFHGESGVPYLRPGYTFAVTGHTRKDFDSTYLTTDLEHAGNQLFYLTSGLGYQLAGREEKPFYRNTFSAIPAGIQFRAERVASKPRIAVTMHAHIDAESSGQYAELDDLGRYKVRLPFDLSDSKGGKASHWLRMAQPYAGTNHGMHFPLHKGTEVVLSFIDGDPDRPLIAAAVPNPVTVSPVTASNNTQARITTAGGNKVHFEDKEGEERVFLATPAAGSFMRLGTVIPQPSSEDKGNSEQGGEHGKEGEGKETEDKEEPGEDGIQLTTSKLFGVKAGSSHGLFLGEKTELTAGVINELTVGTEMSAKLSAALALSYGLEFALQGGSVVDYTLNRHSSYAAANHLTGTQHVILQAGGASPTVLPYVAGIATLNIAATAAAMIAVQTGASKKTREILYGVIAGAAALASVGGTAAFQALEDTTSGYLAKIELGAHAGQGAITITTNNLTENISGDLKSQVSGKANLGVAGALKAEITGGATIDSTSLYAHQDEDLYISTELETTIMSGTMDLFAETNLRMAADESFLALSASSLKGGSAELTLDGTGSAKVMSSAGSATLSANQSVTINGAMGVSISCDAGTINLGSPGVSVNVADLATTAEVDEKVTAAKAAIEAQTTAIKKDFATQQAAMTAKMAEQEAVANGAKAGVTALQKDMDQVQGSVDKLQTALQGLKTAANAGTSAA